MAKAHPFTTVPDVGYLFRRHQGVRHRTDVASRVADNLRFLEQETEYFVRHPARAALRWKRVACSRRRPATGARRGRVPAGPAPPAHPRHGQAPSRDALPGR